MGLQGSAGRMPRWCAVWTVPEVVRVDEPTTGDEVSMLRGLLEWQRATLLWKCTGLTAEELTIRSAPPSTLSLLGVIRHLADAERAWFRRYFRGEQIPEVYRGQKLRTQHSTRLKPARQRPT